MLDVRRLRLLRELALRGTITAVAEALSFTPSAVSQQLTALEKEAGVPLLVRTGRGVRLTPAAERLAGHAEVVLARLESAAAELAAEQAAVGAGPTGPVRIGAFPSATRALLPTALAALAAGHPALEPQVTESDPALVAHAVRAGELDVALVHTYDVVPTPAEPGLETVPLCTERMYLAVPAGCGARTLEGCVDEPWITATEGTLCRTMTLRACRAAGFVPRVRHRIDDFGTVLAVVAAGQGVALVPELALPGTPPAGVTLTPLPMARRTAAAHRAGAGRRPAVAAVVGALRAAVPGEWGDRA